MIPLITVTSTDNYHYVSRNYNIYTYDGSCCFYLYPTGPYATPLGDQSSAWVRVSDAPGDPQWPDVQYLLSSSTLATDKGIFSPSSLGLDPVVR